MVEGIIVILFIVSLPLLWMLIFSFERNASNWSATKESELTVIVPFRNEEERIGPLLESLRQELNKTPYAVHVLFVDDHSVDGSVDLINRFCAEFNGSVKLRSLTSSSSGKKAAVRLGVENASTTWVLTLDADVILPKGYFGHIRFPEKGSMVIHPVRMKGNGTIQGFFSMEFLLFQAYTFTRGVWMANGANLLFKAHDFIAMEVFRTDNSVASGDDMFLLNEMRKQKLIVRKNSDYRLVADTMAPRTLFEGLNQRIRWVGKMIHLKNNVPMMISMLFSALICIVWVGAITYLLADLSSFNTGLCLAVAAPFVIIWFILLRTGLRYNSLLLSVKGLLFLPFYPLYLVVMPILALSIRPEWKGRKLDLQKKK